MHLRALRLAAALLAAAALAPHPAAARGKRHASEAGRSVLTLDGAAVGVRWTDGDSFRIESGPRRGERVRVMGVNALESYGPVHRWGSWDAAGLEAVARGAAAIAAAAGGTCTSGERDGYGRRLAACPAAARALVEAGAAMVFAVDGPADPALLEAQRRAQSAGAGMWRGGVPPRIPTSVHSAGEPDLHGRRPYDRIVDTRTGVAELRSHGETRATCQEICVGEGPDRACLIHVPYERRYRDRPECLRSPAGG
jgi:endonuclease YncB( thermonuclease family)